MHRTRRSLVLSLVLAAAPLGLSAQTAAEHVTMGVEELEQKFDPPAALRHYEAALAIDSMDATANWRAAQALVAPLEAPQFNCTAGPAGGLESQTGVWLDRVK